MNTSLCSFMACLAPIELTIQQGEAVQLPALSISIKMLLHDAQTNVLQHEVQKLSVAGPHDSYLRCRLISTNKTRWVISHPGLALSKLTLHSRISRKRFV